MEKPNICMISGHACIRMQKQALTLLQKGYKVYSISKKTPTFATLYTGIMMYSDMMQLIELIKLVDKSGLVDIYHVHNEPSFFVTALKEITDKPVILDVHDTFLTRLTDEEEKEAIEQGKNTWRVTSEERTNFQIADALVFVSDQVKDIVCSEFKLDQPDTILASYVPEFMYQYNYGRWMGGLVYEGKVILEKELEHKYAGLHYCDYRDTAKQCESVGMDFHLYAGGNVEELEKMYGNSAYIHEGKSFQDLLHCVSRHDWGLVGNTLQTSQWQQTLPNKLFEYLAAGVPVVSINAKASAEIIEEYDIGITVESIEELAEQWALHRPKRTNVIKCRKDFTMEKHIHKVEELYERVRK